ncbi:MAG: hypothetical protein AB8B81_13885 [Halioglobus sp.]
MIPAPIPQQSFQQIHIEVARNATDDFNPFHDKNKWQNIHRNPFGAPIVLGFQLESLIEYQLKLHRAENSEQQLITKHDLRYSNYQFTFAGAVRCDQQLSVDVKNSRLKTGENTTLSNRVNIKVDGKLAILGYKRESQAPLYLPAAEVAYSIPLLEAEDRAHLPNSKTFLKRKYMTNSNAKNFLTGSLAEQADYFDELEDRVCYPEIFPCSLVSCALLEKAMSEGHDFERNPMVYTSHKISLDRTHLAKLRSNDVLHILVEQVECPSSQQNFQCLGVVGNDTLLFRAEIGLIPLEAIIEG